jgi:myo-inositol-1(or 4)-monophosphatase
MLKNVLLQATTAGACCEDFDRPFIISNKEGINNIVTEADHASEKVMLKSSEKFPITAS